MQGWEDRSAGSVRVLNCPESNVQQGSPRSLGTRWPMLLTRSPSTSSASSRYVVSPSYSAYGCIYKCKNLCAHISAFFSPSNMHDNTIITRYMRTRIIFNLLKTFMIPQMKTLCIWQQVTYVNGMEIFIICM